jgi:hypothetical protein
VASPAAEFFPTSQSRNYAKNRAAFSMRERSKRFCRGGAGRTNLILRANKTCRRNIQLRLKFGEKPLSAVILLAVSVFLAKIRR